MTFKRVAILAAALCGGFAACATGAQAQAWTEANTPGFFGGYGHFGGYYDTFGEYGGHTDYRGYVRTEGSHLGVVRLVTVPLQRRSHAKVAVVASECHWLKERAEDTGKRKWKARYSACVRNA